MRKNDHAVHDGKQSICNRQHLRSLPARRNCDMRHGAWDGAKQFGRWLSPAILGRRPLHVIRVPRRHYLFLLLISATAVSGSLNLPPCIHLFANLRSSTAYRSRPTSNASFRRRRAPCGILFSIPRGRRAKKRRNKRTVQHSQSFCATHLLLLCIFAPRVGRNVRLVLCDLGSFSGLADGGQARQLSQEFPCSSRHLSELFRV